MKVFFAVSYTSNAAAFAAGFTRKMVELPDDWQNNVTDVIEAVEASIEKADPSIKAVVIGWQEIRTTQPKTLKGGAQAG